MDDFKIWILPQPNDFHYYVTNELLAAGWMTLGMTQISKIKVQDDLLHLAAKK